MKIKKWHYGKIILLWGWGIFLIVFFLYIIKLPESKLPLLLGYILILLILGIPVILSVITWTWLSGKDKPEDDWNK